MDLVCEAAGCAAKRRYQLSALKVSLYSHGICTVSFFCLVCHELSEFTVADDIAASLDNAGVATELIETPGEILEWPVGSVPPIRQFDVEVFERSSLRHLNDCFRRELSRG